MPQLRAAAAKNGFTDQDIDDAMRKHNGQPKDAIIALLRGESAQSPAKSRGRSSSRAASSRGERRVRGGKFAAAKSSGGPLVVRHTEAPIIGEGEQRKSKEEQAAFAARREARKAARKQQAVAGSARRPQSARVGGRQLATAARARPQSAAVGGRKAASSGARSTRLSPSQDRPHSASAAGRASTESVGAQASPKEAKSLEAYMEAMADTAAIGPPSRPLWDAQQVRSPGHPNSTCQPS